METPTLTVLAAAIRAGWDAQTCDPADTWDAGNPGRGQCGVSALVLQDHLGGDLVMAEVLVDQQRTGYHWWNRMHGSVDIDLTRDQFHEHEHLAAGAIVKRRPGTDPGRCVAHYHLLRSRVAGAPSETRSGDALTGPGRGPEV